MRIIIVITKSASDGLVGLLAPLAVVGAIVGVPFFVAYIALAAIISGLTITFLGRPLTASETGTIGGQTGMVTIIFWIIVTLIVSVWRRLK